MIFEKVDIFLEIVHFIFHLAGISWRLVLIKSYPNIAWNQL